MGALFRGWRRKLVFLNLMLAVLFVCGWVRSYVINDNFNVASVDGVVHFQWRKEHAAQEVLCIPNAPYGTVLLPQTPNPLTSATDSDAPADALVPASYRETEGTGVVPAAGTATGEFLPPARIGLDFDFNVPGSPTVIASPLDPFYLGGEGNGFLFAYDEPMDGSGLAVIAVPYWFLIFPLAILSAIPLIRRRTVSPQSNVPGTVG